MPKNFTRKDDLRLLKILHLKDNEGLTNQQIASRFRVSVGSIAGQVGQVKSAVLPCICGKPQNMDGGMPERWWA